MKFSASAYVVTALITVFPWYYDFLEIESLDLDMTPDRIRKEGYQVEEHTVLTEDGYFLTMHRIPGKPESPTVFVQHGLLSSSSDWVVTGKDRGLAFILADNGYDVWLGNARGNTYSMRHISLDSSDPRYWNFSWHEMGMYDLPAELTYIANLKSDSIIYVGHSMGTTMFYVMAIERPDVASKVKVMFSFAPVAYTANLKSPIRYLSPVIYSMEAWNQFFGMNTLMPQGLFIKFVNKYLCSVESIRNHFCMEFIFGLTGPNSQMFNYINGDAVFMHAFTSIETPQIITVIRVTLLPIILSHTPAGTSMKTFYHYLQSIETGRFQYYSYGTTQNMVIYGSVQPPEYNLSKIEVPIGIFWSDNDYFADPLDVKKFYESIPKKILNHRIQYSKFSHIDYMWATEAPILLYSKLLSFMNVYR